MSMTYEIATDAELKAKAVRCLTELDVCFPYIQDYKQNDRVYLFKSYEGERINPNSIVAAKLRDIEKQYKCKCYAVTYERFSFGRVYSFLIVSRYKEDWSAMFNRLRGSDKHYAYAYCWNIDNGHCSEPGGVIVDSAIGGIKRVG